MKAQTGVCERILEEINARLCSDAKQVQEDHWRTLVRGLRVSGREPESVADALVEFLSMTGGAVGGGSTMPLLHRDYHKLMPAEKNKLEQRYRECLVAAKVEFPHVFYVQVINAPTAPADVWLAERTPGGGLPRLNSEQRSTAKARGIPEREYARSVAAKGFSEERYRFHAERCWDFVKEAARAHSVDVVEVIYDVFSGKFYCDLRQNGRARRLFLDARIVSEPLELGDRVGLEKARNSIRFAVDQALASEPDSAAPLNNTDGSYTLPFP